MVTPNRSSPSWLRHAGSRSIAAAGILLAAALAGCGSQSDKASDRDTIPVSSATAGTSIKPVASIKELMDSIVDPSADGLWDSVATISSENGVDRHEPRTEAEWQAVRRHAVTLAEAMNLVMIEGRRAAPPGTRPNLGELTPAKIDALIAVNRDEFDQFATSARDEAVNALAAIDRKDAKALFKIGGDIDQRCEACHTTFWYPASTLGPSPTPSQVH